MKDGQLIDDNDDMIAEREIFNKIHSKYGFILRYAETKKILQDILMNHGILDMLVV